MRGRLERSVIKRSHHVVTLSRYMMDRLRAHHPIPSEKTSRLIGAVDTQRFARIHSIAEARQRLDWPMGPTILLTVRNLEPRMGVENLLEAISHTQKRDHHLYVVGRGSLQNFLETKTRDLDIESTVTFLGSVSDDVLPLMYQAADIFVLPTRELEGFGLVTVEALASGCPVIATPIGGSPEILRPLDPSLLTRGTSPEDIREALNAFLNRRNGLNPLKVPLMQGSFGPAH